MKKGIDYIGVSAGAVVINKEGKMFLALRGIGCRNEQGFWEFPGGGVAFNESREEAVKREMTEEYGFEIEVMETLHTVDHFIPAEKQHWVATTYICKVKKGEPKILEPQKCDGIGWFDIEEMEKMKLSIITQDDIKAIKQRYPQGLPNFY